MIQLLVMVTAYHNTIARDMVTAYHDATATDMVTDYYDATARRGDCLPWYNC
jgi:hypothetical protein